MSAITHYKMAGGAPVLATDPKLTNSIVYARDAVGNPLSITDSVGKWQYGYDSNNRLIAAVPPNPVPEQPAGGPYEYDWVGNRLNPPANPNPMVYNAADQLMSWPGMHTYTYYPDGSLKEVKNAAGTQVLNSYTYLPAWLLDTAIYMDNSGSTRTLANTWDASSNRVGMTANGTLYSFVYDSTAGIPVVFSELSEGTAVYYIREPGGLLIARLHPGDGIRYYHFDEIGSTRCLTNDNGNVTAGYSYDSYGNLLSHDRYLESINQPYQYVGRLGYYTHWMEPSFGLLQLGIRFYNTEEGMFTQRDAMQGMNSYSYAASAPTLMVDPTGLWPERLIGCCPDLDFAWHYLFGHRRPWVLDYRFLASYRNTNAVKGAVAAYKEEVRGHVRDKARRACKSNLAASNLVTSWSDSEFKVHIDTLLDHCWFTVAEHSFFQKGLCGIKVNCCKKTYTFDCVLDFRMHDYWADPTGLGIGIGGFTIDGSFWEGYDGGGSF